MSQLPVTVLSGSSRAVFARAKEVLEASKGTVAVVAPASVGTKRQVRTLTGWTTTTPKLARWGEGCGCCTVRADVATKVRRIASEGSAERVLVVLGAGDDVVPVAKAFTVLDDRGRTLGDVAHIDALVVALEAGAFAPGRSAMGERVLVQQVELADMVLLDPEVDSDTSDTLDALNPEARVIRAADASWAAATGAGERFTLDRARQRAAGMLLVAGTEASSGNDRVRRAVFRTVVPFHPERLAALLAEPWPGVVRAHGIFWVASRSAHAGLLDWIGAHRATRDGGVWWSAVPASQRPQSEAFQQHMASWHPAFGDRHHELVVAGQVGAVDALLEKTRRVPNPKNRVDLETETAVVDYATDFPAHGQVRVSNELRKRGVFVSPSGVRSIWLRHDLARYCQVVRSL